MSNTQVGLNQNGQIEVGFGNGGFGGQQPTTTRRPPPVTTATTTTTTTTIFGKFLKLLSRSAHQTPNSTNPKIFVYLLLEYFFQIKVFNQYQNTPKNSNITIYIKKTHFVTA